MSEVGDAGEVAKGDLQVPQGTPRPADLRRFVYVMGAGLISLALGANGAASLSILFLVLGAAGYLELVASEGARVLRRPKDFLGSVADVRRALGTFAFGVATLVLAARFTTLGLSLLGYALFLLGGVVAAAWALLFPIMVLLKPVEPDRVKRSGGMLLLWPVALEATGVVASTLSISQHLHSPELAIVAVASWVVGVVLYLSLLAILLGRLLSQGLELRDMGPSYWITMGAAALSSLGAALIAREPQTKLRVGGEVARLAPGAGLVFWFLATALLPLVIGLSVARTLGRHRLAGAPKELWVVVFPAAMYSLASHTLGVATRSTWLVGVGRVTLGVAVAVFVIELGRGVLMRLFPTR